MKYLYDMQGVTGRWQVLLSLLGKMILEFEIFFLGGGGDYFKVAVFGVKVH